MDFNKKEMPIQGFSGFGGGTFGAAFRSGAEKVYIDEVFSPTVWIGNGNNNRDIVNGIDISTEGGMVWIKRRNEDRDHSLFDTIRGVGKMLSINDNTSEDNETNTLTQFNTNGFRLNSDNYVNSNNNTYCSWTFRKCPKFFTMATWSGNATSGRQIAHDLESVPGVIIVKCYSDNGHAHAMYHKDAHASQPERYFIPVDTGTGATLYQHAWNNTAPTSTHFTLGNNADFNGSGKDYVAWIFAHHDEDGEFGGQSGANGDVIKSGVYTGNGSATNDINLGFEPQFLMIHKQEGGYEQAPIYVYDCIRGIVSGGNDPYVSAAFDDAEVTNTNRLKLTATGFTLETSNAAVNENNTKYLYTAIRRPDGYVGKPKTGSEVLTMVAGSSGAPLYKSPNHYVDFTLQKSSYQSGTADWSVTSRLLSGNRLESNTDDELESNQYQVGDYSDGWSSYGSGDGSRFGWLFKRHKGLDVVVYKGTTTVKHSLGVRPEMVWIKQLDGGSPDRDWAVGLPDILGINNNSLALNQNYANGTSNVNIFATSAASQTASQVVLHGNENGVSSTNRNYMMVLFASVGGVSKIGTYSGSDSDQEITLGFQPRFLIVKATNEAYSWLVLDTTRGWASGNNSKYLFLELNWAENTIDVGYPTSTGFVAKGGSANISEAGTSYIYYAHA